MFYLVLEKNICGTIKWYLSNSVMAGSTIACRHVHCRIKYGGVLCSQNVVMLVELMLVTSHRALFLI